MEKLNKITATITFILTVNIALAGGGWTQNKGEGYFKVSEWWLIADQHYSSNGEIDPNATLGIFNTSFYGEYGFTDKLTGIAYFPFFSRALINNQISKTTGETITEGDAINSIGDADVAIKYALTKGKKIALAGRLQFGLPIGVSAGGINKNLQTGDGEFNQLIQIDAGMPFKVDKENKITAYTNIYAGFNNRTNNFSDEVRFGGELGFGLKQKTIWLITKLNGVKSLQNGATAATVNSTSIFANNTEFISVAFEGAYQFNAKWGVSAEYATAVYGRIILARPSYSVGVFYNLKN